MWNVTIRDTGTKDEAITVQVAYKKGDEEIVRNFMGNTQAEINNRIGKYLEMLETRDEEADKVQTGAWTRPEPTPEPEKSAEELAQEEWLKQFRILKGSLKAKELMEATGKEMNEDEITRLQNLTDWVADNRKPEYAALIAD